MMAVILAGGVGARLKPFTMNIPKPLLPLGDTPILEVVLRQLVAAGIDRIVLTLAHMPYLFSAWIGDGARFGATIEFTTESSPLGTAGPLHRVADLDEDFLVMNGDLLTTIDYAALMREHRERRAWGTVALSRREVRIDFGVVVADQDGVLQEYIEKPALPYAVSMGIHVLNRGCLDFIPKDRKFDIPELMMAMKRAGKLVICQQSDCYWQDIGRFDDYQQASADFAANPARFLPAATGA